MASGTRRVTRQDATHSDDQSDEDFDVKASVTTPRKRKARSQGRLIETPAKRRRREHSYISDDIEDDSHEEHDSSVEGSVSDEGTMELNERTGRPMRKSTQGSKYRELSDEGTPEDSEDTAPAKPRARKDAIPSKRSLVVVLRVPNKALVPSRSTRARTAGKGIASQAEQAVTRRSSRISREESAPLMALTSRSPAPSDRRTRALKGLKKPSVSDVIEASQEHSGQGIVDLLRSDLFDVLPTAQECLPMEIERSAASNEHEDVPATGSVLATNDDNDEDLEDQMPVTRTRRLTKGLKSGPSRILTRSPGRVRRQRGDESSEYDAAIEEPEDEEELSASDGSASPQKATRQSDASSAGRRSRRLAQKTKATQRGRVLSAESDDLDPDELAEEAADLKTARSKKRRTSAIVYPEPNLRRRNKNVDYRLFKPENAAQFAEDGDSPEPAPAGFGKKRGVNTSRGWRALHSTHGPFGGGGHAPVLAGPEGTGVIGNSAAGDSDTSDDEGGQISGRPNGPGSTMPTLAVSSSLFPPQTNAESTSNIANHGKVKDKKALADADPLAVDKTVTFTEVGGLDGHINQLKEMVILPLLYPEVFQRLHVTPPRGVLFHGPPGTGKTLLARALASSVSAGGRKINFYMRKGADTLSKYVGEAERQLRVLFEEARKNQPSIIFFDEIDGLAPVRSSKQEQVHASIVATLLALMDGMDGRGQVIVIGATNRPDAVDAALRRPGRFDREFYFPLPDQVARRSIIEIHTAGWEPPLQPGVKDHIAILTKGYGGADLRALCTEAALNAVQGTFPQIYTSNEKLVIDPTQIKVLAKDFIISLNRMIPSSERSGATGSSPLESRVEPLLRKSLETLSAILDEILPPKKPTTALEEAQFDDRDEDTGFDKELMRQAFDRARVYRPRLLVHGPQGMGQQYLGGAILNKYERLFVQSVGLSILYGESARTPEAAVVQLFNEALRHKPSVIYIPNVTTWYKTVGPSVIHLFRGLLRGLAPNDQVLVLGIMEWDIGAEGPDDAVVRDIFDSAKKSLFELPVIEPEQRTEYFEKIIELIRRAPTDYPDLENRKKRILPNLAKALSDSPQGPTKEQTKAELKAQKKADRYALSMLKVSIQPIMENIKKTYKRFRNPPIENSQIAYLYAEADPKNLVSDLPEERRAQEQFRPYEIAKDERGAPGLLHVATDQFYYNMDIVTIEQRLSNGYYKRTKDFLADIKMLAKDAKTTGDMERTLKANELLTNVEVDLTNIAMKDPQLMEACMQVHLREVARAQQSLAQVESAPHGELAALQIHAAIATEAFATTEATGPVVLGERVPGRLPLPVLKETPSDHGSLSLSNGYHVPNSQSNGSFEAGEDDIHMSNSQDTSGQQHDSNRNTQNTLLNRLLSTTQTVQRQVKSSLTPMARDSQVADYHNSASTTTSGQKTSNQSSGHKANTQSTNEIGRSEHPDFSVVRSTVPTNPFPDTQEQVFPSSGSQAHPSQTSPGLSQKMPIMAPPAARNAHSSINALLNDPESSPPRLILDEEKLHDLRMRLTSDTQDFSVEQLEQVNASLMYTIWQKRSDWNRKRVTTAVLTTFEAKLAEMATAPVTHSEEGRGDASLGVHNSQYY